MSLRVGRAKLEVEIEALPSVTLTLADDRNADMVRAQRALLPQDEAHLRSKVLHLLADASACEWQSEQTPDDLINCMVAMVRNA